MSELRDKDPTTAALIARRQLWARVLGGTPFAQPQCPAAIARAPRVRILRSGLGAILLFLFFYFILITLVLSNCQVSCPVQATLWHQAGWSLPDLSFRVNFFGLTKIDTWYNLS